MISKYVSSKTKKARDDYKREQNFFNTNNMSPKWDDSKYNTAKIGDMFAFIHSIEDKAEIFQIIGILNNTDRPEYWDMPEHNTRNVLILSQKIRDDTWTRIKNEINRPNWGILRGTTYTDWNDVLFYDENIVYSD